MTSMIAWFRSHSTAILSTVIAVSKVGLLGKAGTAIVTALAIACGVATK